MKWAQASHELGTRYEDDLDERPRMEADKDSGTKNLTSNQWTLTNTRCTNGKKEHQMELGLRGHTKGNGIKLGFMEAKIK